MAFRASRLDNLVTHKNVVAAKAMRDAGCWFLSPHSPDLNPTEMACSKLKTHLRWFGARTFTDMFDVLTEIYDLLSPVECWNYLKNAGYVSG